jgi:hypothetical protein
MWTEPVREDLDRRAVGGEEGERPGREDGWEAEDRGAVVLEAVIE